MTTKSPLYRLALEANEGQENIGNDVLPTLDERVTLYLRAVHGNREFTEEERSTARDTLLNSMAADIAAHSAEQKPKYETTRGPNRESFLARRQEAPGVKGPLPPHPYEIATRKEATRGALVARHRTSILALTATLGLVLIVAGGTFGYRWHTADEVSDLDRRAGETQPNERVHPPTTSPRSPSTRPDSDKAAREQHVVQIASQRSEADVLAVFRRLQQEQPQLFGQASLSRTDLGPRSYSARVGPFISEKDAVAACLALAAADIKCF
jgi:hypothetical protein